MSRLFHKQTKTYTYYFCTARHILYNSCGPEIDMFVLKIFFSGCLFSCLLLFTYQMVQFENKGLRYSDTQNIFKNILN